MIDLDTYIESSANGQAFDVNWSEPPWSAAYPILRWLNWAPPIEAASATGVLELHDVRKLCSCMVRRFVNPDGQLAWSSYLIQTALEAVAASCGGPPEALLMAIWEFLEGRALDQPCYEFSRAVGRELLGEFRRCSGWDLRWMSVGGTPSQTCFRYWVIGVKPDLWTPQLENESMRVLGAYPFQF